MTRRQVTVAVLAGSDRRTTRAFLALLAPSLVAGDHVVVVPPRRPAEGAERPGGAGGAGIVRGGGGVGTWRTVDRRRRLVRLPGRHSLHEVVVVVDERAVPVGPWLAPLVHAAGEPGVTAAAARTNIAEGDELLVGVPYRPSEPPVHRAFVRRRAEERGFDHTPAHVLSGPTLAVRREVLEAIGGIAALAGGADVGELARRAGARGRLVVAEGSYVHHGGGPPPRPGRSRPSVRPLVSACLIAKDEEENLPRCFESVAGFADEIVVYDTGSSDRTRAIARSAGAVVVEGDWDGDFARARNAALERCSGQWILWIDADEELACPDPVATRQMLAEATADAEGFVIMIDNLRGTKAATALAHPACRLFRRASGCWTGRLHEQVTARAGTAELATPLAAGVRITHWGYLLAAIDIRGKGRRNIASAFADLADGSPLPWATRLVSLGRSYGLAGRHEEAVALCRRAVAAGPAPGVHRLAVQTIVDGLLALDRAEEALCETARLRALVTAPMAADTQEGRVLLVLGRYEEALAAFERVTDGVDDDGYEHSAQGLAAYRATALRRLGRDGDAADVLLAGLRATGGMDAPIGVVVECLERSGRPFRELAEAVPVRRSVAFLGQLVHLDAETADRVLESWHEVAPSRAVLATATSIAHALCIDRQRTWSARLRAEGLAHACPLVASVAEAGRPAAARLLGAAAALQDFGDERGRQAFAAIAVSLSPDERAGARLEVERAAPRLLELFDALGEPARTAPGRAGPDARTGEDPEVGTRSTAFVAARSVVVVDRQAAGLRAMALAAGLRRCGHEVTVVHPQPAAQTEDLLAPGGITVRGWLPSAAPGTSWRRACAAYLASLYARRSFDTVVTTRLGADAVAEIRRALPAARLVVDLDDAPSVVPCDPRLPDQFLAAAPGAPGGSGPPVVTFAASATSLYPTPPPVPEELRRGVCVVGDFLTLDADAVAWWSEHLAPLLSSLLGATPVAVVGDDPGRRIARSLPGATSLGPIADPLPWLRTARVTLVATRGGAAHWLSASAMCGTPALLVPEDDRRGRSDDHPDEGSQLARAVAALGDPDLGELWRRIAPGPIALTPPLAPPLAPPLTAPLDPLATLPPPSRRSQGGGGPGRGVPGVWWKADPTVGRRIAAPPAGARASGFALAADPVAATVEVRDGEVPDFAPTLARRLAVAIRWGLGNLPAEWVGAIRDRCDDVWVATRWGWGQAVASGVAPEAVHVVPPGVDTAVFSPAGERGRVRTRAATKLLAVSDCSERSGIDALLESYLSGFGPEDAVCLVVLTTDPAGALGAQVRAAATPGRGLPAVEVVEGPLPAARRAALYRACDVLVHPDRATSSPDALLEAMACGLATIVPDGGATSDLCDGWTSWIVRCRQVPVDPADAGVLAAAGRFWQLEPDRDSLSAALEAAAGDPDARLRKGLAAHERVAARFTLDHRTAAAARRIAELVGLDTASPARSVPREPGAPGGSGDRSQHRPHRPGSVLWSAPFFNHSGYGEEARGFLRGLSALGWRMVARSTGSDSPSFVEKLWGSPTLAALVAATGAEPAPPVTAVLHAPGVAMQRVPGAAAAIGRTMFETDGLPAGWVARLNCLDEVWVPSAFNAETFRRAGTTVPLHVVPGGVDTARYRPGCAPLELPGARGTVYLAIFEWTRRKAPDVLLRAWAEAFDPGDPACLVLRCFPKGGFDGDTTVAVGELVDAEIARLGLERQAMAPILVLGGQLRPEEMPRLMAAADVFVGVSRGEGWGRPLLEAMACGLPTVGTRWSGNLDFMTDRNSLLVEIDGLGEIGEEMGRSYRGQRWAEPSAGHLAELLGRLGRDPAWAARLGERARADVEARWSWEHAAAAADRRLIELVGGHRHRGRPRAAAATGGAGEPSRLSGGRVRWVGDFYGDHSFATVNRELCARLVAGHGIEIDAVTGERPPYPPDNAVMVSGLGPPGAGAGGRAPARRDAPAVEVRHGWPPSFAPPNAPALVVMQPWEYGGIPEAWVAGIRAVADEVWAPTTWVRDCFVRSGLPEEMVALVPLGVDTATFRPEGPRLDVGAGRTTRLLFVGGAIRRKGFDLLLDAFVDCFGPDDDVCLVLKLFGSETFYRGETLEHRARAAARAPRGPSIEVVDRRLTKPEMAALYRACDVLVHPYRGEGFGLPVAEAMACGLPTIVTAGGACLDFCDQATSWMLPAHERPAEVRRLGPSPIGYWVAEPDPAALRDALRDAVADPAACSRLGEAAAARIAEGLTWDHTARAAVGRLERLWATPGAGSGGTAPAQARPPGGR